MHAFLTTTLIIISVLLIAVILLQNKNVTLNLSSMWGWMWEITKRWPEKVLHNATILLWVLFVINTLAFFFMY